MKKIVYAALMLTVLAFWSIASPDKIEHHGYSAESEGSLQDCMSCHDGSKATKVVVCTTNCRVFTQHPVLRKYPPERKRESYASLEEVTAKGVKIVDGMITCISCHNLKNPGKRHLVVDENGRHCTICHMQSWHPPMP